MRSCFACFFNICFVYFSSDVDLDKGIFKYTNNNTKILVNYEDKFVQRKRTKLWFEKSQQM